MDLTASATALRQRLLTGETSASALLEATLARIEAANPALNAVVAKDAGAARAAAADSDARLAAGQPRALEGLPITIKDSFDVAGMLSTAGAPAFRERIPEADATAVARLRNAGAVIVGKSNVPVFTSDFQAANPVYGVTRNPWDHERSPGGSSGGAAVAVATGMSAFELASDLGGSARWPAHACGIFGLRTTWNLVPFFGHVPPLPERRMPRNPDLMVAGPLARSAADLDLVLPVLSGETTLKAPRRTDPQGLRVALWLDDPFAPVQRDVAAAVRRAARLLADAGAVVDETARPGFRFEEAFEVFALLNHMLVAYSLPPKVRERVQRLASNFAPGDLSHRALQARGARMTPGAYQQVTMRKRRVEGLWARFFQRFDVVLCPPAPVLAIPHDPTPDFHARTIDIDGEKRPYLDFLVWASLAAGADLPLRSRP
jgi:amidase